MVPVLITAVAFCRMLDILEKFMIRKGYSFCRLDGSTPMGTRQTLVDEFNDSPSKQVISFFFCEALGLSLYILGGRNM